MSIERISGTKNGYRLCKDSTNEEFRSLLRSRTNGFKCLIVNKNTYECFGQSYWNGGRGPVTVNNKLLNGEFYINHVS